MANTATIRNAYGMPAMFAGSKTGSDDAAFVFVRVGDEERRMRWAEWDSLPAWTGPRPSWGPKSHNPTSIVKGNDAAGYEAASKAPRGRL
ncbi:hypothetical protein B5V03_28955 [Bradyrhizobium betae]|uniref:Uncharacterized protein n=1 Tax=Bradyrhizobium betae TaxID=244734 RepID=A0A4V1P4M1_9BRAD|nr:hypothetical protein B5V03_28955 [Bradyrhizobium betae]